MSIVWWLLVAGVVYPYLVYPVCLVVLSLFRRAVVAESGVSGPVTIVCAVHNEEAVIAEKIRNFYALEGEPRLLLGLDGCTDGTERIVRESVRDGRVIWYEFDRIGKSKVINALMRKVDTPYVVMTDANSMCRPDAVKKLLGRFQSDVGVVCGRLMLVDATGKSGEGFYWRFETWLKRLESPWGMVMGTNGAIYAFRRELFSDLPSYAINDDFMLSMKILERGWSVVYAPDAVALERVATTDAAEFQRHVRDGAGHVGAMAYLVGMLNPLYWKRFFFYTSHRVMRWLTPLLLVLMVPVSWIAGGWLRNVFWVQCAGYALSAMVIASGIRWKPLYVPAYFVMVNAALLVGYVRAVFGMQRTTWASTARE